MEQEQQLEMSLMPPELRPPAVVQALNEMRQEFPDMILADPEFAEIEDNGWLARANLVPLEAVLYGYLDSREDSDFYMVEELDPGETVRVGWYRMGRTNLKPQVRIYDQNGEPVRTLVPRNFVEIQYKLPKGQHIFYIQVSDYYGPVGLGAGGYNFSHYLLRLTRGG